MKQDIMKKLTFLFVLILLSTVAFSQTYEQHSKVVSIGIQPTTRSMGADKYNVLPVNASFEYMLVAKSKFSFGLQARGGYFNYDYKTKTNIHVFDINIVPMVHYSFFRNFDAFAGYRLGYSMDNYKKDSTITTDFNGFNGLFGTFCIGARYYIKNVGIYVKTESTGLNIETGVSFKF